MEPGAQESCDRTLRSPLCRMAEGMVTLVKLTRLPSIKALLEEKDLAQRLTCCWVLALLLLALGVLAATAVSALW